MISQWSDSTAFLLENKQTQNTCPPQITLFSLPLGAFLMYFLLFRKQQETFPKTCWQSQSPNVH